MILLFSITYVSAAASLNIPSSLNLGEKSRNETVITTFSITNNGNVTLTNIIPYSSFSGGFNATGFNLTVNEIATIKVNLTIPEDSSTGNVTIGNIYFRSNEYNSSSFPVIATVKGGLEIYDLDVTRVTRDGSSDTDSDVAADGELDFGEDEDIGPGSTLEFDFRIENLFSDSDDIEIHDVSVLVTIKEIDDEEDIDEESDTFDLDPEEKDDVFLELKIPLKVKDADYDIEILVEGEDDDGVEHKVEWNLEMEVKKESHDLYIQSASLTKDKLSCSRVTSLKGKVINLGNRDEDDVKIEAKNPSLDLDYAKTVNLVEDPYDDDNEYEAKIPIVVKDDVKAGTYPIDFNVYLKGRILFDTEKVNLVIEDCKTAEEIVEEEEETKEENESVAVEVTQEENVTEGEQEQIPILGQEKTITEEKEPVSKNIVIIGSVIVTISILAVLILYIVLFYIKKSKQV